MPNYLRLFIGLIVVAAGCAPSGVDSFRVGTPGAGILPNGNMQPAPTSTKTQIIPTVSFTPTWTRPAPTEIPATPLVLMGTKPAKRMPTETPFASGPYNFASGVNPLTGLALDDPSLLFMAPGLVSISNAPVTARPQAGLSYGAQVYEFYLGEGDSRFLAVFYGNLPPAKNGAGKTVEVRPLRSGRLPYETLRQFYNGYLVFASAAERVLKFLDEYRIVQNRNIQDINGAAISVADMMKQGESTYVRLGPPALEGQRFDPTPPEGGKPANRLWMAFHLYDQVFWKYDAARQAFIRWQDQGPGTPLRRQVDTINGLPLAFSNVVVLFTNYVRWTDTYFNIDFKYVFRWPALLFRDGKMYNIFWTTRSEKYEKQTGRTRPPRYINYEGEPFPLKPGQTWVEIVQLNNRFFETSDSQDYHLLVNSDQPGSGNWGVVFNPPDFTEEK